MILNRDEYRDKVLGCWLGKNIGGTLGEPFEWRRQINDVTFYTKDLGGQPAPNDDLDIQLLWLIAMEEQGVAVDARLLGEYWTTFVTPHWSEYGIAKVNMRSGLVPPLSGSFRNDYKDSCGAFIRSEIWACIAPGCPQIAAQYAYEDAIIDHGNGEGTYGEVFTAALESAAFVEGDIYRLIDIALSYIPADSGVAGAVQCAIASYQEGKTWVEARDALLEGYRGGAFFGRADHVSPRDHEKGFATGRRGWDAPSNIGIVVLGLLYGECDFDRTLCTTVNCGEDTDCTGATVGSLFGILHGARAIPERWVAPIGRGIQTVTLDLGDLGHFGARVPATVDNLTERTERLAEQVLARYGHPVALADAPTDLSGLSDAHLYAGDLAAHIFRNPNGPIFRFPFFDVAVDYGSEPTVRPGVPRTVRITLANTYRTQANVNLRWYAPEGWTVLPASSGVAQALPAHLGDPVTLEFTLVAERVDAPLSRLAVECTIDGRPTAMLVPIALLNGSLLPAGDGAGE